MARIGKTFSFDDELDKEILDKLDSVRNKSDYVKSLILKDLKENKAVFTDAEKASIKKIVMDILENYDLQNKKTSEVIVDKKEKLQALADMGF